jgi:polyisoprenoid-binding protein YceI
MSRYFYLLALGVATSSWIGCANPADDVAPAQVGEAKAVTDPAPAVEAGAPSTTPANALVFSGEGSKIDFTGSKVTGKHDGGFKVFNGTMTLSGEKPELESIAVEIDMNSTWSDNDNLTGHLKNKDFFEVETYPKASFTSTAITPKAGEGSTHAVTGNFSLHGVTKSISFPAKIEVSGDKAMLSSEFFINRKDFKIEYAGKTDDLIRDEVVIRLSLSAAKPPAAEGAAADPKS